MSDDGPRIPVPFLLRGETVERRDRAQNKGPKRHERDVAKATGGRITPGSGSGNWQKGDVSGVDAGVMDVLIECKRSEGVGLRVEGKWLSKITAEASRQPGRVPALSIRIEGVEGAEKDWVAVPLSVFERLLAIAREPRE